LPLLWPFAALALLGCGHDASQDDTSTADAGPHDASPPLAPDDAATDAGAGPFAIPMAVTQTSSNGTTRFSILVSIGNAGPIPVQLDTGSSGLRIEEGAVPDSAYASISTTAVTYSYHSGLEITGVVATATVSIGPLSTPQPIPVMLIQAVGCVATDPNCGAAGQTPATYDLFGPYKAILGVGMRNGNGQIGNPVAQLAGAPAYVVEGPDLGGDAGTLLVAPTATQLASFATYQLPAIDGGEPLANGVAAFDDRYGLPTCIDDTTSGVDYCVPAELDTGDPSAYVEWPGATMTANLPSGAVLHFQIGPDAGVLASYEDTVGSVLSSNVTIEPATGAGFMNIGQGLFSRYDALFDQKSGTVGLAAHP
jgi:hypothetical protein